ncbi:FAD-binding oxidoreductase, partial [Thioclava sp. BHET1]
MLDHLYEPAAYDAASLDGCYWASTIEDPRDYPQIVGEERSEFAVIGAGFAGLSAALHLAQSGADVSVLDMHRPGWGASGRNGGFCCLGG